MWNRILSIIQQEYFITKRSLEVIFDLFFFSSMTIIVFGFVSKYLAGDDNPTAAFYLIIGLLLWEIVRIGQYSITVSVLWNVWARNLSNMFVSPLQAWEYLVALMLSSIVKVIVVLVMLSLILYFLFNFNVLQLGFWNLVLHFTNLIIFSWAIGVLLTGVIFRYGTRIQAMSWGLIFLFQPLTAAFFPLEVLPEPVQKIAYMIPATYVFEAARKNYTDQTIDWNSFFIALFLNLVYMIIAFIVFFVMFRKSRQTGQFARNEG